MCAETTNDGRTWAVRIVGGWDRRRGRGGGGGGDDRGGGGGQRGREGIVGGEEARDFLLSGIQTWMWPGLAGSPATVERPPAHLSSYRLWSDTGLWFDTGHDFPFHLVWDLFVILL